MISACSTIKPVSPLSIAVGEMSAGISCNIPAVALKPKGQRLPRLGGGETWPGRKVLGSVGVVMTRRPSGIGMPAYPALSVSSQDASTSPQEYPSGRFNAASW